MREKSGVAASLDLRAASIKRPAPRMVGMQPGMRRRAARFAVGFAVGGWMLACTARGAAQQNAPQVDPRKALMIPSAGAVHRGQGQRVVVRDAQGKEQVCLLHAEVGDRRLVILPNGRLESVPIDKTEPTTEAFQPSGKEEIASQLKERGVTNFKMRSTARYVYVYNTSDEFTKGTSRILETMYPAIMAYFKRLKFPVHDPQVPLVAVMFRTEEEFRRFDDVPQGVAAYYDVVSNRIVMYEQSKLVEVAPELALKQAIGTVAHEGIHQILHNIGVQERLSRWPLWLAEGLAEYFAPTSLDARLRWKGVGTPNDLRMYELDRFLKQDSANRGEMVEQTVTAPRLSSTGYASAWGLTHYLASRQKEKFQGYLREVARLGPLEPRDLARAAAENKKLFVEFFGADFGAIEDAMIKHLKNLPYVDPIANQTHYVVLLKTATSRTIGVTASPAAVRKWQEEALTKIPPAVQAQATFEILPFANKLLADEYAKQLGRVN
jgi:uncharacterized protein DUF1570